MRLGKAARDLLELGERQLVFGVRLGQLGHQGVNFSAKLIGIPMSSVNVWSVLENPDPPNQPRTFCAP